MATFGQVSASFTSVDGTKTVTITPVVGDLVVIVTAHTGNTSATAPTDDNADGLGTYTEIAAGAAVKTASADQMRVWIRNAFIGSATSTIFTHAPGTTSGGGLRVVTVQGMPAGRVGSAAARQAGKQDNQSAATPAPVFPGVALTANFIITTVFNGTNPSGMTIPGSYTQLGADSGYGTPTTGRRDAYRASGETGTTITWGSASGSAFCSMCLELDTSAVDEAVPGYQRIYGPTHLGTSAADLYTVPDDVRVRLRHIYANNPSGSPVDFTFSVGTDSSATRLYDSYNVPAGGSLEWAYDHVLEAGEKIQAFAGTASTLVLNVDAFIEL